MPRKKKGDPVSGWINLNKPAGMTSTQALGKVRRFLNAQKAGHAGTLDPLASGVLPIALGEATKTISFAQDRLKTYRFTVGWGEQRDTDDREGEIIATSDHRPSEDQIRALLPNYTGEIDQIPPLYSAIKVDGARAYDLARAGKMPDLKSRTVYIETLTCLDTRTNDADFEMTCGKGTYVRSLARDMAIDLGTKGYVSALERTAVGPFFLKDAISLDKMEQMDYFSARDEALRPLQTVLDDIPALSLKQDEVARLQNGQKLAFISRPDYERLTQEGLGQKGEIVEVLAIYDGAPIALVEAKGLEIQPVRVFNI